MAKPAKLGRPTDQRMAIIKNIASNLLWMGRVETTFTKAKAAQAYAEKILTLAMKSYEDKVKVEKEVVNAKGVKVMKSVMQDGPKKLDARRKIMAKLNDLHEIRSDEESKRTFEKRTKNINHPLMEKIFNELAPRYAKRAKDVGQGGGYTRILRTGTRRGDDAETAIIELV